MCHKGRLAFVLTAGLALVLGLAAVVSAAPTGKNGLPFRKPGYGWALPRRVPEESRLQYELNQVGPDRLQLTVRNSGKAAVELEFTGATHNLILRDGEGRLVWQLADSTGWMQVIRTIRLEAGEQMEWVIELPPLAPGRYTAEAYLLATGYDTAPVAKRTLEMGQGDQTAVPPDHEGSTAAPAAPRFELEAVGEATGTRLVLTLHNPGEEPLNFTFMTGQEFDFLLRDLQGQEVWRWSAGQLFAQALHTLRLESGESRQYAADLPAGLKPGLYTVEAWFMAEGYGSGPAISEKVVLPPQLKRSHPRPLPTLPWLRPTPVWPQPGDAQAVPGQ